MSRDTRHWQRQIDRALLGDLGPQSRRELQRTLRDDRRLRADYDRAALALRVFEGEPDLAPYEIDLVESWLVADLTRPASAAAVGIESARQWWSWRTWLSVAAAAAAAVALLILVGVPPQDAVEDYAGIKGGSGDTALAIEALCGPPDALRGDALVAAQELGCSSDDTLTFSYALQDMRGGVLSLFGVDADGDPMYYAPIPDDLESIVVKPGHWRAVGAGVRLNVNHAAGITRLYGLVSPVAPTIAQIDTMAASLATAAPATDGNTPWLEHVDPAVVRALCPVRSRCHTAELSFLIHTKARGPVPASQESQ